MAPRAAVARRVDEHDGKGLPPTAVEDGLIAKNPCHIKGGGTESAAERPIISASQALDLADRMPDQYRMLVLLAVFGSLRWGEVTALRRSDVDIERGTVTVRGALSERSTGEMILGPPSPPPDYGPCHCPRRSPSSFAST